MTPEGSAGPFKIYFKCLNIEKVQQLELNEMFSNKFSLEMITLPQVFFLGGKF